MSIKDFSSVSTGVSSPEEEEAFKEIESRQEEPQLPASVKSFTMHEHKLAYDTSHRVGSRRPYSFS